MNILERFILKKHKKSSAAIAKERLQIIVAHESHRSRQGKKGVVDLQELQQKLINVIADYLNIEKDQVSVELAHHQDRSILELNVTLPEEV
jgi:cell division topological specificity factor